MEENNLSQPNPAPSAQNPPGQKDTNDTTNKVLRSILAICCFALGSLQLVIPAVLALLVLPQLIKLYHNLNLSMPPSAYIGYVICAVIFIAGIVNIYLGIKVLKGSRYTIQAIIFLIVSFFLMGALSAGVVLSVINPIYKLVGNIDNSSENTAISSTPTPDPTTNWKTYSNSEYNFSFKYPPMYDLRMEGKAPYIYKDRVLTDAGGFAGGSVLKKGVVILFDGYTNKDISENALKSEFGTEILIRSKSLGGENGTLVSIPSNQYEQRLFIPYGNNKTLAITLSFGFETPNEERKLYAKEFEQILSTFKFTDSNLSPSPTCTPRPACLDATPRCMIPELESYCKK